MPKKTTALIILLSIITAILVFMAVKTDQAGKLSQENTSSPIPTKTVETPIATYTNLYFSPSVLDLSGQATPTATVDLIVDTQGKEISAVQAELSYDPKIISNVIVTPISTATINSQSTIKALFPGTSQVSFNDIDPVQGRISFARQIGINDQEVSGIGKVASITFNVNKFSSQESTSIMFLDKSLVSTLKSLKSVLKSTTPLIITLKKNEGDLHILPVTSSTPVVVQ